MTKELEALEHIGICYVACEGKDLAYSELYGDNFDIVEKGLKALEILKKILKWENGKWNMNLYDATKEERELLKEVLGNE